MVSVILMKLSQCHSINFQHSIVLVAMFVNFYLSIALRLNYCCSMLRFSQYFGLLVVKLDSVQPILKQLVVLNVSCTHNRNHSNLQYNLDSSIHSVHSKWLAVALDSKKWSNLIITSLISVFFVNLTCFDKVDQKSKIMQA